MNIEYCDLRVYFSEEVITVLKKYIQYNINDPESGGIITGKIYNNFIEILSCSEPTILDKQSRYNFNRSYKAAQKYIDEKFNASNGEEIYLGEWHTHPEDIPTPSKTDIRSFNKTLSKNILNSDIHFMIIVGKKAIHVGVYFQKKWSNSFVLELS